MSHDVTPAPVVPLTAEQAQQYEATKLRYDLVVAQLKFEAEVGLTPSPYLWQRLAMLAEDIVAIVDPEFAAKMRGDDSHVIPAADEPKVARRIRTVRDFSGDAALYRLDPPLPDGAGQYVVVSTINSPRETLAFTSDSTGEVVDWAELVGVRGGDISHAAALEALDYEIRP